MTVSLVTSASTNGTAGTRSVTLAAAPVAGDVIVVAFGHGGAKSALTVTTQSGWTTLVETETGTAQHATKIVAKVADGTEGSTYTTGSLTGGNYLDVLVLRSTIGFPAIGSLVDQTGGNYSTATERTVTPAALSQASTVAIAALRGATSQSSTLAYWDGSGTGVVPHHRSANGVVAYEILSAVPSPTSIRFATYASGSSTISAVWIKESTVSALWPAGTADDLVRPASTDDMVTVTPSNVVAKINSTLRRMIAETGANPSGALLDVATRLGQILPLSGGTVTGPVVGAFVLKGDATAPLHAVPKQQVDATIPAGNVTAPAAGDALVWDSATSRFINVASPWSTVAKLPTPPLISDYQQAAPLNAAGVEYVPCWDTDIAAFDAPSGTLAYVDPVLGLDTNPGTSLAPKRTITGTVNALTVNTKLILRTGDYRETIPVPSGTSKLLGIQAERGARVKIKGSDILSGWTYEPTFTRWVWSGVYQPALVNVAGTPATDQLFVDSVPFRQSTTATPADGYFYVDTTAKKIYVGRPASWNPAGHIVEATARGYLWGTATASCSRSGFFLRGLTFEQWGSDDRNAVYAALNLRGSTQLVEYCVLAHASCAALDTSNAVNLTVNQVAYVNNGALGWHSNNDAGTVATKLRLARTNWDFGFDVTPGTSAHYGGMKITGTSNFTGDRILAHDNNSNAIWFDVGNAATRLTRIAATDSFGFGFTGEMGQTLQIANAYFARNGQLTTFSRDGYRISGYANCELWNITSSDNVGAAFEMAEDWRTYSANLAQPAASGDTFNTRYANNINIGTARGTRALLYTLNGQAGGAQAKQTPAFTAEMMFASDPWVAAASQVMNDHHNLWIRLSSARPVATWAQPTTDFNGTGWGASASLTLAQMQTRGGSTKCEVGSFQIDDFTATVAKYLPGGDANPSISSYATIPGDALNRSTTGAVVPDWVADALGVAHGTAAKFGCYTVPAMVQT